MAERAGEIDLRSWVRAHNWAVTTHEDCLGLPPGAIQPLEFALYDADEDDPPIAIFTFKEDAMAVAQALNEFGRG